MAFSQLSPCVLPAILAHDVRRTQTKPRQPAPDAVGGFLRHKAPSVKATSYEFLRRRRLAMETLPDHGGPPGLHPYPEPHAQLLDAAGAPARLASRDQRLRGTEH